MPVKTDKAVKYPVQHEGKKTTFDIFHNGTVDEVQTDKFKIGVKIAEFIESFRKPVSESTEETAGRLYSLYKEV